VVGPGSSGIGYSSCYCSDAGMLGPVLATIDYSVVAARESTVASRFHAACPYSYRDCSSLAHVVAWFDCY
jgi:hypothetical protein